MRAIGGMTRISSTKSATEVYLSVRLSVKEPELIRLRIVQTRSYVAASKRQDWLMVPELAPLSVRTSSAEYVRQERADGAWPATLTQAKALTAHVSTNDTFLFGTSLLLFVRDGERL